MKYLLLILFITNGEVTDIQISETAFDSFEACSSEIKESHGSKEAFGRKLEAFCIPFFHNLKE